MERTKKWTEYMIRDMRTPVWRGWAEHQWIVVLYPFTSAALHSNFPPILCLIMMRFRKRLMKVPLLTLTNVCVCTLQYVSSMVDGNNRKMSYLWMNTVHPDQPNQCRLDYSVNVISLFWDNIIPKTGTGKSNSTYQRHANWFLKNGQGEETQTEQTCKVSSQSLSV